MHRHAAVPPLVVAAVWGTLMAPEAQAVEPGIDIAAPRVAITTVDAATIAFHPARIVVEQNDHVRWRWTGGLHNTTSGPPCTASGLWNSNLNSTSTGFTRLFAEDPAVFPFFCAPHCGLGMNGQVVVTQEILLTVTQSGPLGIQLDWSDFGPGQFRVFRSTSPAFAGGTTTTLTPAAGTNTTTFLDQTGGTPPVGTAHYYLVMNWF